MKHFATMLTTLFVAGVLVAATPGESRARNHNQASVGAKVADAVLLRPVMLVVSLAGSGLYLATTPLTVPTGIADETAKVLFRKPWKLTNGRPLGAF